MEKALDIALDDAGGASIWTTEGAYKSSQEDETRRDTPINILRGKMLLPRKQAHSGPNHIGLLYG